MIQVASGSVGYPGVVSNGSSALRLDGITLNNFLSLRPGCAFFLYNGALENLIFIREGLNNDGLAILHGVGLFGHSAPGAAIVGGVRTAGAGYTANEQAMLEAVYTALQAIGLVT